MRKELRNWTSLTYFGKLLFGKEQTQLYSLRKMFGHSVSIICERFGREEGSFQVKSILSPGKSKEH